MVVVIMLSYNALSMNMKVKKINHKDCMRFGFPTHNLKLNSKEGTAPLQMEVSTKFS